MLPLKLLAAMYGLLIGSFLNVIIHRVPREQSFVTPRSKCPKCSNLIKWYQNIPVFSYLVLRGKCANCKNPISIRYPLVELLIACIAILLFPDNLSLDAFVNYICLFSIACLFVAMFLIDVEFHLLPDKLNLALLIIILPYAFLTTSIANMALGFLIGFGGTYLITYLFYKLRGQIGLGGGDIKLFGVLGILLGPEGILQCIFFSALVGSVIGIILIASGKMNKNKPLAFGPYIIIVAAVQIYFPKYFELINIYNLN